MYSLMQGITMSKILVDSNLVKLLVDNCPTEHSSKLIELRNKLKKLEEKENKLTHTVFILNSYTTWTAGDKLHCRVYKGLLPEVTQSEYTYAFSDGWLMGVSVLRVNAIQAKEYKKNSNGFFDYDWMIHSIIKHNEITLGN